MAEWYALSVGINKYADTSANLSGCVNDANDWTALAFGLGYHTEQVLDYEASRSRVLDLLEERVAKMRYRDRLLFTYSGHGSKVLDRNGDEPDGYDEVLVMSDFTYIKDDDLKAVFDKKPFGTRITVISDSCHSGSVTRFGHVTTEHMRKPRYLPAAFLEQSPSVDLLPARRSILGSASSVLFSGCHDDEFSYDAWFGNRANGAFTRAAIDTFEPGLSIRDWHGRIRRVLPNDDFPQSPQLSASYYQSRWSSLA